MYEVALPQAFLRQFLLIKDVDVFYTSRTPKVCILNPNLSIRYCLKDNFWLLLLSSKLSGLDNLTIVTVLFYGIKYFQSN